MAEMMKTGTIDKIEKQDGDPAKGGAFWTIQIGDARYLYFDVPPVVEGDKVEYRTGISRNGKDYIWKGSLHKLTTSSANPPTTASGQANAAASAARTDSLYRSPDAIQAANAVALAKDLTLAWSSNASASGRELSPVMFTDVCYQFSIAIVKMMIDAEKELGR